MSDPTKPYHLRFREQWTDRNGRWHYGAASIWFGDECAADNLEGRDARKWLDKLNKAYARGLTGALPITSRHEDVARKDAGEGTTP